MKNIQTIVVMRILEDTIRIKQGSSKPDDKKKNSYEITQVTQQTIPMEVQISENICNIFSCRDKPSFL